MTHDETTEVIETQEIPENEFREFTFTVGQYAFKAAVQADQRDVLKRSEGQMKYIGEELGEFLAIKLESRFRLPHKVLQDDKVIAKEPVSKWDHFLCAVGLDKYARFKAHRLTEHLVFPNIAIPPEMEVHKLVWTEQSVDEMVGNRDVL